MFADTSNYVNILGDLANLVSVPAITSPNVPVPGPMVTTVSVPETTPPHMSNGVQPKISNSLSFSGM